MKIDRLFHVLVIGGAALGCSSEGSTPSPPDGSPADPKKDAAPVNGDAGGATTDATAEATAADAARDAIDSDGCAPSCQSLPFPCCWMDCTQEPMCVEKLCK